MEKDAESLADVDIDIPDVDVLSTSHTVEDAQPWCSFRLIFATVIAFAVFTPGISMFMLHRDKLETQQHTLQENAVVSGSVEAGAFIEAFLKSSVSATLCLRGTLNTLTNVSAWSVEGHGAVTSLIEATRLVDRASFEGSGSLLGVSLADQGETLSLGATAPIGSLRLVVLDETTGFNFSVKDLAGFRVYPTVSPPTEDALWDLHAQTNETFRLTNYNARAQQYYVKAMQSPDTIQWLQVPTILSTGPSWFVISSITLPDLQGVVLVGRSVEDLQRRIREQAVASREGSVTLISGTGVGVTPDVVVASSEDRLATHTLESVESIPFLKDTLDFMRSQPPGLHQLPSAFGVDGTATLRGISVDGLHWQVLVIVRTAAYAQASEDSLIDAVIVFTISSVFAVLTAIFVSLGLANSVMTVNSMLVNFSSAMHQQGANQVQKLSTQSECATHRLNTIEFQALSNHVSRMMTAVQSSQSALQFHMREIARVSQEKDHLMRFVLHELRNPLHAGALAFDEIADTRQGQLAKHEIALIDVVKMQFASARTILDDTLLLQKGQARKLPLDKQNHLVRDILSDVELSASSSARALRVVVDTEVAPGVPREVRGDRGRLAQVLNNLVSNAMKHVESHIGRVRVSVGTIHRSDLRPDNARMKDIVRVTGTTDVDPGSMDSLSLQREKDCMMFFGVADNGCGIPREVQNQLSEPFFQVMIGDERKGSGLGLNICRMLVRLHGGEMYLKACPGKGSRFFFTLPCDAACETSDTHLDEFLRFSDAEQKMPVQVETLQLPDVTVSQRHKRRHSKGSPRTNKNDSSSHGLVLIVDDSETNRLVMSSVLQRLGFRTAEAEDGLMAVSEVHRLKPDVVLMDRRMPKLYGCKATERLRSEGVTIPIIGVTGDSMLEDLALLRSSGASEVLVKPVRKSDLIRVLKKWFPHLQAVEDAYKYV